MVRNKRVHPIGIPICGGPLAEVVAGDEMRDYTWLNLLQVLSVSSCYSFERTIVRIPIWSKSSTFPFFSNNLHLR